MVYRRLCLFSPFSLADNTVRSSIVENERYPNNSVCLQALASESPVQTESRQRQGKMASPTAFDSAEWSIHKRALHRTGPCDSPEGVISWPSLCPGGGHQASAGSPFDQQIRIRHPLQSNDENLRLNPCTLKKIALFDLLSRARRIWFGHLLESLERLNLKDNTVVMFLSDHGTQIWDKGKFGKGGDELYSFNTQLNWFIRHPDGPKGHHTDAWVQNHDLTPTILKMMGIPYEAMDGQDVWPIAMGKAKNERDHITTGWADNMNVRDENHSVHFKVVDPDPKVTVYDLKADPEEDHPLPDPPNEVADKAMSRAADVVGPLPVRFTEFKQRNTARSMRSFAPSRFGEASE